MNVQARNKRSILEYCPISLDFVIKRTDYIVANDLKNTMLRYIRNSYKSVDSMTVKELNKFDNELLRILKRNVILNDPDSSRELRDSVY